MESPSVQNKVRKNKTQSRIENLQVGTSIRSAVSMVPVKEQKQQLPHFYSTPIFKSKKNDCL